MTLSINTSRNSNPLSWHLSWPAHQDCPVSGEIYTVGAGHVARFFIGRTKGYYKPALAIEDVRDHLAEIRDDSDFTVPGRPADEIGELFGTIMTG
jgi:hypothetical protein